jgi:hypothetical protein
LRNLHKILTEINNIEKKINLNEFKFFKINYWPILRTEIIKNEFADQEVKFTEKKKFKLFFFMEIIYSLNVFFQKPSNIFLGYKNDVSALFKQDKSNLHKQFHSLKNSDIYRNNLIMITTGNPFSKKIYHDSYDFSLLIESLSLLNRLLYRKKIKLIQNKIYQKINSDSLLQNISSEVIQKTINNIVVFYSKKKTYDLIWRVLKPKNLILKSFNNLNAFAAICSANENKINTIEYQHGQQGENSLTYSNWLNIPENGFSLIPRLFWVWDDIFKIKFQKWMKNQNFHKVETVGFFWKELLEKKIELNKNHDLISDKKIILYCLQYPKIENTILNVMRQLTNVTWMIRLHPRTLDSIEEINDTLKKIDSLDYDLNLSNQLNFEIVLMNCDILITKWSTVAFESLIFGKKTIIFSKNGFDAYKIFIDQGKMFFADSEKELKKLIES